MRWSDLPLSPSDRMLRQFAGLWLLCFGALALWHGLARGRPGLALGLGSAAAAVALVGLSRPRAIRPLFVGWMIAAFPIGWAISNLTLGLVYFGLFLPLGLLFRLVGRDALALRPQPDAATFWRPRDGPADVRRYFRQF